MIRYVWSVLCGSSSIDKDDNKVSLFDVIEQITVLEPYTEPGLMPFRTHLVTMWRREDPSVAIKGTARVKLFAKGEEIGSTHQYAVDLTKVLRWRQRIVFGALPVTGEGVYEFVVELLSDNDTWREVGRVPFDILIQPPPLTPTPDVQ